MTSKKFTRETLTEEMYLKLTERTEPKFPKGYCFSSKSQVSFKNLNQIIKTIFSSKYLDIAKRSIYYNETKEKSLERAEAVYEEEMTSTILEVVESLNLSQQQIELLHHAIGMVTEAGEFLEAVFNYAVLSKPLDYANVGEEIGDTFWYAYNALRILNLNPAKVRATNIAKLYERFPDKFTEEDALNRDLNSERKILESGVHGESLPVGITKKLAIPFHDLLTVDYILARNWKDFSNAEFSVITSDGTIYESCYLIREIDYSEPTGKFLVSSNDSRHSVCFPTYKVSVIGYYSPISDLLAYMQTQESKFLKNQE
jgi:NTP pyrophosphatase (non-canonical NTP hydrolase)